MVGKSEWVDRVTGLLNGASTRLSMAVVSLEEGDVEGACRDGWKATVCAVNAGALFLWREEVGEELQGIGRAVERFKEEGFVDITKEFGNAAALLFNTHDAFLGRESVRANLEEVYRLFLKVLGAIQMHNVLNVIEDALKSRGGDRSG